LLTVPKFKSKLWWLARTNIGPHMFEENIKFEGHIWWKMVFEYNCALEI
jgi:hypothetical protein